MQEGTIVGWQCEEGQTVARGDALLKIETEKIVNSVEAPVSGTLRRRLAEEGETRLVGALIGVFADADIEDADVDAFIDGFVPADASFGGAHNSVRISPVARRLAERSGLDVASIQGTGRNGRISKRDVEAAAEEQCVSAQTPSRWADNPPSVQDMSGTRRTIARRLVASRQNVPHFCLTVDLDVAALLRRRARLNADRESGAKISVNDLLVRACALALMDVPDVNVHVEGTRILTFPKANIALAMASDDGLTAPVLRAVNEMSLDEVSAETHRLADAVRNRRLERSDLEGGTFTVSNLGMYGIRQFDAVINPPQGAILAAGAAQEHAVVRGGAVVVGQVMTVTLACDHRAIDGATGARFLAALRAIVETPEPL